MRLTILTFVFGFACSCASDGHKKERVREDASGGGRVDGAKTTSENIYAYLKRTNQDKRNAGDFIR